MPDYRQQAIKMLESSGINFTVFTNARIRSTDDGYCLVEAQIRIPTNKGAMRRRLRIIELKSNMKRLEALKVTVRGSDVE